MTRLPWWAYVAVAAAVAGGYLLLRGHGGSTLGGFAADQGLGATGPDDSGGASSGASASGSQTSPGYAIVPSPVAPAPPDQGYVLPFDSPIDSPTPFAADPGSSGLPPNEGYFLLNPPQSPQASLPPNQGYFLLNPTQPPPPPPQTPSQPQPPATSGQPTTGHPVAV